MVINVKLMKCELMDFKTLKATVRYDEEKDKIDPVFVARIGTKDLVCQIANHEDRNDLTYYRLLLPNSLSLQELREKIEMMAITSTKKVSKIRLKKIRVIDYYANKVKDISFFPQVETDQTIFRLFSPLAKSAQIRLFKGEQVER